MRVAIARHESALAILRDAVSILIAPFLCGFATIDTHIVFVKNIYWHQIVFFSNVELYLLSQRYKG